MMQRVREVAPVAALAIFLAGCALTSGSERESVGEGMHSIRISTAIRLRYQADRVLAPLGLTVETFKREVFISGLAQNEAQRSRAMAIARETSGVVAAYFVDTDLPGRPVSRAHIRAGKERVWGASLAAVREAGYRIETEQERRFLVTRWKQVAPSWVTLWEATHGRIRLALYPNGEEVTLIAVADRLDEGSLRWQITEEEALLRRIQTLAAQTTPSRP